MHSEAESTTKAGVDLARVRDAAVRVLAPLGLDLFDVEWLTDQGGWTLRVTIERAGSNDGSGGVSLEDCVDVSRALSEVLDAEDFIAPHYNLEVSSPGLDRPLRSEADFARFRGQTARVKLARPAADGQRLLRGPLDEAPAGSVAVVVDGKRIEAPYADVVEANLVFELSPQPKRQPRQDKSKGKGDKPRKPARS
jgi:ribosome maturation factor RimP